MSLTVIIIGYTIL